ncbi:host attachment family protein [Sphingobium aquiterrae]|uniref:host attachment family protein n=1 Tax=Sphingobium aquiterrae TaxID=2038656 RepID=UPI003016BEB5
MLIDHGTLIMVADGRKMLVFRNAGTGARPRLETEAVRAQDNPASRDQASDAPGRMDTPRGPGSAMEPTDFHDLEERHFAQEAAALLNRRALDNDFEKLIIVAPPTTLGEMRRHYHKAVEQRLVAEIAKDLSNHPVPEIEKIIDAS